INSNGEANRRISVLGGMNLFDDRLNIYGTAEHVIVDEVKDEDVKWRRDSWTLLNNDTDAVAAPSDGQLDNILIKNARSLTLGPRGGMVLLAGQVLPSPAADPDIPAANCALGPANSFNSTTTSIASSNPNCFAVAPELNKMYVFSSTGVARFA